jgi:hypothetical protein
VRCAEAQLAVFDQGEGGAGGAGQLGGAGAEDLHDGLELEPERGAVALDRDDRVQPVGVLAKGSLGDVVVGRVLRDSHDPDDLPALVAQRELRGLGPELAVVGAPGELGVKLRLAGRQQRPIALDDLLCDLGRQQRAVVLADDLVRAVQPERACNRLRRDAVAALEVLDVDVLLGVREDGMEESRLERGVAPRPGRGIRSCDPHRGHYRPFMRRV